MGIAFCSERVLILLCRMPRTVLNKDDPEYLEKRKKNNEAIKRSREKARQKASETQSKVETLRGENKRLEDKLMVLGQEMKFLKDVFMAHAGVDNSTPAPSTSSESTVSSSTVGQEDIDIHALLDQIDQPQPGTSEGKRKLLRLGTWNTTHLIA